MSDYMMELVERRERLSKLKIVCPKCGEDWQIQLKSYLSKNLLFRGRMWMDRWETDEAGNIVV